MTTRFLAAVAVGLVLGAAGSRAGEQAEAKALLDKAMKALGGKEKLAKLNTASVKGKITLSEGGKELSVEIEGVWKGTSQYRADLDVQEGDNNFKGVLVINGEKGWLKKGDQAAKEAPEGMAAFIQNLFYAVRMPQLLPALSDKAYKLTTLAETKVDEKDAVGLLIEHKDRKDVSVYFDKKSGLPLKSEVRLTEPGSGKEITVAYHYGDYKKFDGVKFSAKIILKVDDKELTAEVSEIKSLEKVEASQFDMP
jgi:hypothetical protein